MKTFVSPAIALEDDDLLELDELLLEDDDLLELDELLLEDEELLTVEDRELLLLLLNYY